MTRYLTLAGQICRGNGRAPWLSTLAPSDMAAGALLILVMPHVPMAARLLAAVLFLLTAILLLDAHHAQLQARQPPLPPVPIHAPGAAAAPDFRGQARSQTLWKLRLLPLGCTIVSRPPTESCAPIDPLRNHRMMSCV